MEYTPEEYAERLNTINALLETTNIRGKEYIDVAQRVAGFRALYPMGAIIPELIVERDGECIAQVKVYADRNDPQPLATGHAHEVRDASAINRTSYIENCETSAVGRALGFLAIGATSSIASADEVARALERQDEEARRGPQRPARGRSKPAPAKEADEAAKAARRRLNDACKAYALVRGERYEDVAARVAADPGRQATAEWYGAKAKELEQAAQAAGVEYEEGAANE